MDIQACKVGKGPILMYPFLGGRGGCRTDLRYISFPVFDKNILKLRSLIKLLNTRNVCHHVQNNS